MHNRLGPLVIAGCLFGVAAHAHAQAHLIGITGNQQHADQQTYPDVALFTISLADASTTLIDQLTWIPDSHAIGFNPENGLIYHAGGSEAWSDDPNASEGYGFRDHQYMETYDTTAGDVSPIFNANPPPSPDQLPAVGLNAPRPIWVQPQEQRLLANPSPREKGPNEYHAARNLAWSESEKLFYVSDEDGLYKLTPDGQSTFVGPDPALALNVDYKAVTFYDAPDGSTRLLAGTRRTPDLFVVDPATGQPLGAPVQLQIPLDSVYDQEFGGLLGMAQNPETGFLYGIRNVKTDKPFDRELIRIDPNSGETLLIDRLGLHFTSLAFTYSTGLLGDFNGNGVLDAPDIDELTTQVAAGSNLLTFDLNSDASVDDIDIRLWVSDLLNSWIGDANLDGEFNSGDLVVVLSSGTYEADVDAVWSTGDFNGDGRTNTSDLVAALTDGGYESGPRGAVAAVPEPSSWLLLSLAAIGLMRRRRR